jgi:hypothetical protein
MFASRSAEKASSQVQGLLCHLSGDLNSPGAGFFLYRIRDFFHHLLGVVFLTKDSTGGQCGGSEPPVVLQDPVF